MAEIPLTLEPIESLESMRAEWSELASATRNVFSTWEWNALAWSHFGRPERLLATACRDQDGRLVAILPVYLWRAFPVRVVRFIGHHGGDDLGPVCAPDDIPAAAAALGVALDRARAHVFLGERMPGAVGWASLLRGRLIRHLESPSLRFSWSSWDEFLHSRSANFREQARRRERKLFREQDARFRLADDPDSLDRDIDALFALHGDRWAGATTTFSSLESFHREFAATSLENGWLRLWFLEVDDEPVAACYGFRFGDVESFFQGGRALAWQPYSVGFVLLLHAIREALQDGMSEYRLLLGGEEYKGRFANVDEGLDTVAVSRGLLGGAAATAAIAASKSRMLRRSRLLPR